MKGLLFTFALSYGGAVVSLVKPYHGFLIYVAFAILKPEALWHYSIPPGGNYSRILAVGFLIGWALHGLGSWKFGKAGGIVVALMVFWAILVFGAITSPNQVKAWASLESMSKIFLPFVAGVTMIDSVEKLKQLAWVIVLAQGYLAYEFNLLYYTSPMFLADSWMFGGLDNNGIAITLVSVIGAAFFLGLHANKWWQKGIAFACAGLMSHAVLFSMSRGGMLAMGITGGVIFWLTPKRPIHFVALILGVALVIRLAGASVQEEFFSSFADKEHIDGSAESRFLLTYDALDCMVKNPLFGCGMENWGNAAVHYGWAKGKEAHNTWAQLGAELGFPGFLSILAFYGLGCWRLLPLARGKRQTEDPWIGYMAQMVLASIAGFFVSAALVTVEGVELPYYIMVLGAGTLKVHSSFLMQKQETDELADAPEELAIAS